MFLHQSMAITSMKCDRKSNINWLLNSIVQIYC